MRRAREKSDLPVVAAATAAAAGDVVAGVEAGIGTAVRPATSNKLPRVQDPFRVEGMLYGAMKAADFFGSRKRPPGLLRKANAVFAGNCASPIEHLAE